MRRDETTRARWEGVRESVVEGLEARFIGLGAIRTREPHGRTTEGGAVVVNRKRRFRGIAIAAVMFSCAGYAAAQKPQTPVTGQGTAGKVTKWTSATTVGDSNITEDKFGRVGIGVTAPTTRLAVAGVIESVSGGGDAGGGFKFPDGTFQRSAGLTADQAVTSVNGLRGDLSVAGSENIIVTPSGNTVVISAAGLLKVGEAVTSLDGLTGDVTFAEGPNITITRTGNTIQISAADNEQIFQSFDADTFDGDGSQQEPFTVALPLVLTGDAPGKSVLFVRNGGGAADGSNGITGIGGFNGIGVGGIGVKGEGGQSTGVNGGVERGGPGVVALGGLSGGTGIVAIGAIGLSGLGDGLAGEFDGDVVVNGDIESSGLSKRSMDHPLDPENKLLRHASVESSEELNVYSGNAVTDGRGAAVVLLPDWFEAVNTDVRYQLTVVGTFARAIVAEEVRDNRFTIKTDEPNVKVSWQLTGVRADAAAKMRPFTAVEEKPDAERGSYLTPEAFGQPAERGVEWVRHPELKKRSAER